MLGNNKENYMHAYSFGTASFENIRLNRLFKFCNVVFTKVFMFCIVFVDFVACFQSYLELHWTFCLLIRINIGFHLRSIAFHEVEFNTNWNISNVFWVRKIKWYFWMMFGMWDPQSMILSFLEYRSSLLCFSVYFTFFFSNFKWVTNF